MFLIDTQESSKLSVRTKEFSPELALAVFVNTVGGCQDGILADQATTTHVQVVQLFPLQDGCMPWVLSYITWQCNGTSLYPWLTKLCVSPELAGVLHSTSDPGVSPAADSPVRGVVCPAPGGETGLNLKWNFLYSRSHINSDFLFNHFFWGL